MSNTEVIIITYLCYNYACNIFHCEKNLIFTIKYLIILTIVPFVGSSLISIIKYLTNTIGMQIFILLIIFLANDKEVAALIPRLYK